jgi:hypothetical protein
MLNAARPPIPKPGEGFSLGGGHLRRGSFYRDLVLGALRRTGIACGLVKRAFLSSATFYTCGSRTAELGENLRVAAPLFRGEVLAVDSYEEDMTAAIRFDVDSGADAQEGLDELQVSAGFPPTGYVAVITELHDPG